MTADPLHGSQGSKQLTTPLISLEGVHKTFGEQVVLRDVSLSLRRGETLVVVGPSGCGKSVTLKLMLGLLDCTDGAVLWDGCPVANLRNEDRDEGRRRIGFLFQGAALFDSLTVFENVAFGLRHRGAPEEKIREAVERRLIEVGLSSDVGLKKPADLSGGMRKRVGLARAMALAPEIMLYDEPTTGLDPIMSAVIDELILRTADRSQVTSVVVTHDMRTVRKVATKVVMLQPARTLEPHESQVVFSGTPAEFMGSQDSRVASFVRGDAEAWIEEGTAA